jgi:NitT/TauT family transport system permease protein
VPRARRVVDRIWPRLALVGAILLLWWVVVETGWFAEYLLPSPGDVWRSFTSNLTGDGGLIVAAERSLLRLAFGMAAAVAIGTLIGLAMAASTIVQRSVGTLMTGLQALPSISWLPLAIIWLSLSERAILFVVVIGAVPAIAIATAASVRQVPPSLVRAGRTLGAGGWELYRGVVLPAAIPGYWSGLQQGWAIAWRALMAGELISTGARGLGHFMVRAGFRTEDLLAAMAVIAVIGVAVDYLFAVVDRRIRRRRGLLAPG